MLVDFNGFLAGNIFTVQHDVAVGGLIDTGQQIEYGGFSCAVGADETVQLSLFYLHMETIHSAKSAKGDSKILYFQ